MIPATNILELYKNLAPGKILTKEEAAFRVALYEDKLSKIRFKLVNEEDPRQTIYIAGQTGSGKSTSLNFLDYDSQTGKDDEEIHNKFAVIPIHCRELLDLNDVDIYQLLLVISHSLVKGREKLEDEFEKEIEKIYKTIEGRLVQTKERGGGVSGEAGAGVSAGTGDATGSSLLNFNPVTIFAKLFNVKGDFFAKLRTDAYYRNTVKDTFGVNTGELIDLTNKIIHRYKEWVSNGKEILLVIHDLDHIRLQSLIEPLFIDNRNNLERLNCKKVLSVPGYLFTKEVFAGKIVFFGLKIKPNPIPENPVNASNEVETNRTLLKEIIHRRIAEGLNLVDEDALERAVDLSGGLTRQFISIVYNAALKVAMLKGAKVTRNDIEDGAIEEAQNLNRSIISSDKIEILEQVRRTYKPAAKDEQLLVNLLLGSQIVICQNSPDWYNVNPLIEKAVESYAKALPKSDK